MNNHSDYVVRTSIWCRTLKPFIFFYMWVKYFYHVVVNLLVCAGINNVILVIPVSMQ